MPIRNGLHVPKSVREEMDQLYRQYAPLYPPTHPHAGQDPGRQSVGDPGHCEACALVGHVRAHPDYGCGDVGCNSTHAEDYPTT